MPSGRARTISSAAATGVTGSSPPTETSVGASTRTELIDDVEVANEIHSARVQLKILRWVCLSLFVRQVRAEGGEDAGPFLIGHRLAGIAAPGDLRDLVARDAANPSTIRDLSHRANPD